MTVFRKDVETQQPTGNVESILISILNAINSGTDSNAGGATEETLQLIKNCLDLIKADSSDLAFKTKLLQVDKVGNITYLGYAEVGSIVGDPVWAIQRWTETGQDAEAKWADGDKSFDNVWDDRLSLTYS